MPVVGVGNGAGHLSREGWYLMPETKAQRSAAARRGAATRKRHAAERKQHEQPSPVERTSELSDEVLKSLESGQRPSRRQEIVDAAMEMADRLVHTQYDFLRHVVQSAGKTLTRQDEAKK